VTTVERVLRALSIANLVLCVWLVLSGVFLFFCYRPTAAAAWEAVSTLNSDVTLGLVIQTSHRVATPVFLVALSAWAVVLAVAADFRRSSALAGTVFLTVGAAITGFMLPWDQLALWAVTVGTNMMGYTPVFGEQVKFVLLGGSVIGTNTLLRWYVLHVLFVPFVTVIFMGIHFWRVRKDGGISGPL